MIRTQKSHNGTSALSVNQLKFVPIANLIIGHVLPFFAVPLCYLPKNLHPTRFDCFNIHVVRRVTLTLSSVATQSKKISK